MKAHHNHGGDPAESERLRAPFLTFVGKGRSVAQVCRLYDLPYCHIGSWLSGRAVLDNAIQSRLKNDLHLQAEATTPRTL